MAYGNMGDTSGTGVLFTRNPATGEDTIYGEYLINAQGEDVVAGIRTPKPIHTLQCVSAPSLGQRGARPHPPVAGPRCRPCTRSSSTG